MKLLNNYMFLISNILNKLCHINAENMLNLSLFNIYSIII